MSIAALIREVASNTAKLTEDVASMNVALERLHEEAVLLRQILTEPPPEIADPPCTHPVESRSDQNPTATFWKCKSCGKVYDREQEG